MGFFMYTIHAFTKKYSKKRFLSFQPAEKKWLENWNNKKMPSGIPIQWSNVRVEGMFEGIISVRSINHSITCRICFIISSEYWLYICWRFGLRFSSLAVSVSYFVQLSTHRLHISSAANSGFGCQILLDSQDINRRPPNTRSFPVSLQVHTCTIP